MQVGRKIKTPCKKRSVSKCKSAKKSCKYVCGSKRKYCRTRKNRSSKKN